MLLNKKRTLQLTGNRSSSRHSLNSDPNTISYDIDKANERVKRLLHQTNSRKQLHARNRLLRNKRLAQQANHSLDIQPDDTESVKSISSLRMQRRLQQQRQTQIRNRLKYIELERERNMKTAEWARRKYSLMVERRTHNLQMKSMLEEERSFFERENKTYVMTLKERGRQEREQREQKIKQWKSQHRQQAEPIKLTTKANLIRIHHTKQQQKQQNKHKALDIKRKQSDLQSKKSALQNTKRAIASRNHRMKLVEELQMKRELLKHNQNLFSKLVEKSEVVKKTTERAKSELQRLEQVMNSRRSSGSRMSNSIFLTKQ